MSKIVNAKVAKIVAAGAIEKDGKMTAVGNYNYHSIDGVIDYLRAKFRDEGLLLTYDCEESSIVFSASGAIVCSKLLNIRITDVESGQYIEGREFGLGVDKQDKAPGKATSYALKTYLLTAFMLKGQPDEDDCKPIALNVPTISHALSENLKARVILLNVSEKKFLLAADAKSFSDIPESRFEMLNERLDVIEAEQAPKRLI